LLHGRKKGCESPRGAAWRSRSYLDYGGNKIKGEEASLLSGRNRDGVREEGDLHLLLLERRTDSRHDCATSGGGHTTARERARANAWRRRRRSRPPNPTGLSDM